MQMEHLKAHSAHVQQNTETCILKQCLKPSPKAGGMPGRGGVGGRGRVPFES